MAPRAAVAPNVSATNVDDKRYEKANIGPLLQSARRRSFARRRARRIAASIGFAIKTIPLAAFACYR